MIAGNDAAYEHIEETQLTCLGSDGMKNGKKNSCAHKHQPISDFICSTSDCVCTHFTFFLSFFFGGAFCLKRMSIYD